MSEQILNSNNFKELVLESDKPVLVDFWATWCGPCLMMAPVVAEIAEEMQGKAVVGKVDIDDNPALADSYGIEAVPTLLVFKGGKVVNTFIGYQGKDAIIAALK